MPILIVSNVSPSVNVILRSLNLSQILIGAENFTMPEELDPTTARLISELSASMLPVLTKSLMSAIPSTDFSVAVERNNRTLQELRSVIEKALRSAADDSRAGRSMIIQSIGTVLEEITGLRAMLERLPEIISSAVKEIKDGSKERENEKEKDKTENEEGIVRSVLMNELEGISERIDTLTEGLKSFFESYAEERENVSVMLRAGIDSEALTGIEGLIRAEGKSHSKELEELSREISAMTEENNTALVHEVREAVGEEIGVISGEDYGERSGNDGTNAKILRFTMLIAGAGLMMTAVNLILLLMR